MTPVKPCPPERDFDWQAFHKQLDIAFAHFIAEAPEDVHGFIDIPIIKLIKFSDEKRKLQEDTNHDKG